MPEIEEKLVLIVTYDTVNIYMFNKQKSKYSKQIFYKAKPVTKWIKLLLLFC